MKLKIDTICLSGIDRCGKDTMYRVVGALDRKYILECRGLPDNITYNRLFGRETEYALLQHKNTLYVHLYVAKPDWLLRCKLTNEPPIDYEKHVEEFCATFEHLHRVGLKTMTVYTSEESIYNIAKKILEYADSLNNL